MESTSTASPAEGRHDGLEAPRSFAALWRLFPERGGLARTAGSWAAFVRDGVTADDITRVIEAQVASRYEESPRRNAFEAGLAARVGRAVDTARRLEDAGRLIAAEHSAELVADGWSRLAAGDDEGQIAGALVRLHTISPEVAAAIATQLTGGDLGWALKRADAAALEKARDGAALIAEEQQEMDAARAKRRVDEAAMRDADMATSDVGTPAPCPPTSFDLKAEPGLLGDVARWCAAMAFRPVPEFAQPAALATLAPLFGRRFATPTGLGLNLYLVGIAETGGGKDALVSAPRVLLSAAGFRHLVGPGDFTSDAAIEVAIRTRPVQIMPLDEFGKLAQAMTGRQAPAFAKLAAKSLLELYPRSAPHAEWSGKQRAGDGRDSASEVVFSPTLSIVGVSTPGGFFEGMTEATLEDGMLNRLTLVVGGRPGDRQRDPLRLTPPPALLKALQAAYEASTTGNLQPAKAREATAAQAMRIVPWADCRAEAAINRVEEWEDDAVEAGRGGICGRAAEQTQKVATIRALGRNPSDPAVSAQDVEWAWEFVLASIASLERGARDHMASSAFEELCKSIERAVVQAGPSGLPWSKLLVVKGVSKSEPRLVTSALDRLKERGVLCVDISTGRAGGRPGKRVRPLLPAE